MKKTFLCKLRSTSVYDTYSKSMGYIIIDYNIFYFIGSASEKRKQAACNAKVDLCLGIHEYSVALHLSHVVHWKYLNFKCSPLFLHHWQLPPFF